MIKLEIPFRLPGLNEYTEAGDKSRYHRNTLKQDTENDIMWFLKSCKQKINSPVFIKFIWYEQTYKRDKDNVAFAKKFILDALQKAGILQNDNNKYISGFSDFFVYGSGDKVVIEIKEREQ